MKQYSKIFKEAEEKSKFSKEELDKASLKIAKELNKVLKARLKEFKLDPRVIERLRNRAIGYLKYNDHI